MKRASPLRDHPFWEEAQLIRELLREDRAGAHTGRVLIPGDPDIVIPRLRYKAQQLERMARIDINYTLEDN